VKGDWFEMRFSPRVNCRLPGWARRVCITPDGRAFLPAAMAGNELMVLVVAGGERDVKLLTDDHNHLYVPADWMMLAFPKIADMCRDWVAAAREIAAETGRTYG
jgi:hypothetical protein